MNEFDTKDSDILGSSRSEDEVDSQKSSKMRKRKRIGWNYQNAFSPITNTKKVKLNSKSENKEANGLNRSFDDIEVLEVLEVKNYIPKRPIFPPSSSRKEIREITRGISQSSIKKFFSPVKGGKEDTSVKKKESEIQKSNTKKKGKSAEICEFNARVKKKSNIDDICETNNKYEKKGKSGNSSEFNAKVDLKVKSGKLSDSSAKVETKGENGNSSESDTRIENKGKSGNSSESNTAVEKKGKSGNSSESDNKVEKKRKSSNSSESNAKVEKKETSNNSSESDTKEEKKGNDGYIRLSTVNVKEESEKLTLEYSKRVLEKFNEKWQSFKKLKNAEKEKIKLKILKTYEACHPTYVQSRYFINALEKGTQDLDEKNIYLFITDIVRNLKKYKDCPYVEKKKSSQLNLQNEEEILSEAELKRIKKLAEVEGAMLKLIKKIKKVDVAEADLDDEVNSSYILSDRYKIQLGKLDAVYCKLANCTRSTGRPIEKKFRFESSRFPEINKRITVWINKYHEFPDYQDILKLVKEVSARDNLPLRPQMIRSIARDIFEEVGQQLQKRRVADDWYSIDVLAEDVDPGLRGDPADDDPELERKLKKNAKEGTEKLKNIFQLYSDKQVEDRESLRIISSKGIKVPIMNAVEDGSTPGPSGETTVGSGETAGGSAETETSTKEEVEIDALEEDDDSDEGDDDDTEVDTDEEEEEEEYETATAAASAACGAHSLVSDDISDDEIMEIINENPLSQQDKETEEEDDSSEDEYDGSDTDDTCQSLKTIFRPKINSTDCSQAPIKKVDFSNSPPEVVEID